jgi:hypothetical protein
MNAVYDPDIKRQNKEMYQQKRSLNKTNLHKNREWEQVVRNSKYLLPL